MTGTYLTECGRRRKIKWEITDEKEGNIMEISLLLIQKIASLFLIILAGWTLVKTGLLKSKDSRTISVLSLYMIVPCTIISAFEVECTPDVRNGLILAVVAAILSQGMLVLLASLIKRPLKLDRVEQASMVFSNAGNLIMPLVLSILGPEWVIYSSAYVSVQLVVIWSYGKALLCGERGFDLKKILTNVNMIAVLVGIVFFAKGLRMPGVVQDAMDSMGAMLGPAAMLVTGMLMAEMDLGKALRRPRLWMTVLFRLVVFPACTLALLKFSPLSGFAENGKTVLLITLMATMTPSASTVTQMSQVYGADADYASSICMVSTLLCVVTMPIWVSLYMM